MVLNEAIRVLKTEADGILKLVDRIDFNFSRAVDIICNSKGRVIISGIGKSGLIGRKISATLNSTGTKSVFLHPVEAVHGDLGMVCYNDVFLAVSYSGETSELNVLLPSISKIGCNVIAFTGNINSTLSALSDVVIDVAVEKEACPLGLAPTASTTALLAMGDALAVVLIDKKQFKFSDFKKNHPGGALGRRLAGGVKEIMLKGKDIPIVEIGSPMEQAIYEMNRYGIGSLLIVNCNNKLKGIITDGDLRRLIIRKIAIFDLFVDDVMIKNPQKLFFESATYDALNIMEKYQIMVLPIVDMKNKVCGIIHLHDVLGKGAFRFNGA